MVWHRSTDTASSSRFAPPNVLPRGTTGWGFFSSREDCLQQALFNSSDPEIIKDLALYRRQLTLLITAQKSIEAEQAELQLQRDAVTRNLAATRASLVQTQTRITHSKNNHLPVYKLPMEILGEIFILCQQSGNACPHAPWTGFAAAVPFEILISQVSWWWRDVVLGTPALWCRIATILGDMSGKLNAYLERSNGSSLDITIHSPYDISEEELRFSWSSVSNHLRRIRSMVLNFKGRRPMMAILSQLIDVRVDQLMRFTVNCVCDPAANDIIIIRPFSLFRQGAPALKYLDYDHNILPISLPWYSSVSKVRARIACTSLLNVTEVIPSFTNLASLALDNWRAPQHTVMETIHLPQLRSLIFSGLLREPDYMAIFTQILTPNLESLAIKCTSGPSVANMFIAISVQACQEYKHLRLLSFTNNSHFYPSIVEPALSSPQTAGACNPFEHVQHVAFIGLSSTDKLLLHLFCDRMYPTPRLPRLRSLTVGSSQLSPNIVKHVLLTRKVSYHAIPHIHLQRPFADTIKQIPGEVAWFMWNVNVHIFDADEVIEAIYSERGLTTELLPGSSS